MARFSIGLLIAAACLAFHEAPAQRPLWLAAGPQAARRALEPLMTHRRERGLDVEFLAFEDVQKQGGALSVLLRKKIAERAPGFVLLIGDGRGTAGQWVLPPLRGEGPSVASRPGARSRAADPYAYPADVPFGDFDSDGLPDAAVGRLPARDADELAAMVSKILRYERETPGGGWQGRLTFVTGEGHYGLLADTLLEKLFARVVKQTIPEALEIGVTYTGPRSPYFWPPAEFAGHVKQRLEAGSLFFNYVGHGSVTAVDRVGGFLSSLPVMDVSTVRGLEIRGGAPVFTVLACWTANIVSKSDCIGEVLMRAPKGPVAFVGATVPSDPYGNAVLGYELARHYNDDRHKTLGSALDGARRALAAGSEEPLRRQIDLLGKRFGATDLPLKQDRYRHVSMYLLLGDPALELRRPRQDATLDAPESTMPGSTLALSGTAAGVSGAATISLRVERHRLRGRLPRRPRRQDQDFAKRTRERWALANRKVVSTVRVNVQDGRFGARLAVPADLRPGRYFLRFEGLAPAAGGGIGRLVIGAREIRVTRGS